MVPPGLGHGAIIRHPGGDDEHVDTALAQEAIESGNKAGTLLDQPCGESGAGGSTRRSMSPPRRVSSKRDPNSLTAERDGKASRAAPHTSNLTLSPFPPYGLASSRHSV
jgi:hypothetical protein